MQSAVARTAIVPVSGLAVNPYVQPPPAEPEYLSECSPRDKPWDSHRSEADEVSGIYTSEEEFERLAARVAMCSQVLGFAWAPEKETPEVLSLKLRAAHFCRVRHCPICQWRRALMWLARFLEALPALIQGYPSSRFVFLTLTRRNVSVTDLRESLKEMNRAWDRLSKKVAFKVVLGWVRTTEVTRGADGSAHPHFHVLLMVPGSYFNGKNYITQAEWTDLWQSALRADYRPIVDVRAVKGEEGLIGGVRETLKYAVKPADMVADHAWFKELTRQLHKLRFIAAGGVLKNVLRPEQESEEDLLLFGDEHEKGEEPSVFFDWSRPAKKYKRRG